MFSRSNTKKGLKLDKPMFRLRMFKNANSLGASLSCLINEGQSTFQALHPIISEGDSIITQIIALRLIKKDTWVSIS